MTTKIPRIILATSLWYGAAIAAPSSTSSPEDTGGVTVETSAPASLSVETKEQRDARLAWWREAKFGMFIHWGVYAVPARRGEWVMHSEKIPVATYKAFAKDFNPVQFDPTAWAKLAKDSGIKYMVITAKHHEGFALYPSDVTDWNLQQGPVPRLEQVY